MGSQHLEYRVDPIYFLIVPLISGASIPHLATKTVNMFGLQTSFVLSLYIQNVIGIKELLPTRKLLTFFLHQTLRIGCRAALIILLLICRAVYILWNNLGLASCLWSHTIRSFKIHASAWVYVSTTPSCQKPSLN